MSRGIFGNQKCMRCGACCVYYAINEKYIPEDAIIAVGELPEKVFKLPGAACQYLRYDSLAKKAECIIHDSEKRPCACKNFFCDCEDKETKKGLRKIAESIGGIAQDISILPISTEINFRKFFP